MNAEYIIANAVEDVFANHRLLANNKTCSCGRWGLPSKERQFGTSILQYHRHVAEEVAKRLTQRAAWTKAAAA